jgi:hypothetical protein
VPHDPAAFALRRDPQGPGRFDGQARIDPSDDHSDGVPIRIRWARTPLEHAAVTVAAGCSG